MRKLFFLFASVLMASLAYAQDAPLYTALGQVGEAEGYDETYLPEVKDVPVDVYDGSMIIRGFLGVEGYDLKVVYDEDDNVESVTPIVNGVEGTPVESGYLTVYTGLEDPAYIQPYIGDGYCYAGVDEDGGYALLYAYVGEDWGYYYIDWENETPETPGEEDPTVGPLYSAIGEVGEAEGYGSSSLPALTDVNVDVYDDYIVIANFLGAEGYDLKVTFGEDETVTSVTPIIKGEEGTTVESGYATLTTGLLYPRTIRVYVSDEHCFGYIDGEEGYVMLGCYVGAVWGYYYLYWPKEEEGSGEEENPEAQPLYTALGEVTALDGYGDSYLPQVRDVAVDVYEDYVIIRGLLGVEGYDLKVVPGEDDSVVSVTPIVNGEEGDAVESGYLKVYTGLDSPKYFQPYIGSEYSYANADEAEGYVMLYCYVGSDLGYYYIYWPQEDIPDYISTGEVTSTEGWGESLFPELNDLRVEAYNDYLIIRAFAGTAGYDIKVGLGENDNITYLTSIVDDEEVETATSGLITLATGNDIVLRAYLDEGYGYAGLYEEESGYVIFSAYVGDDWSYYYCAWPQGEGEAEWTNPFDRESTYLYSAKGVTSDFEDWGETLFPATKDIAVDVYDNYIYIHAFAGVEGHDIKVAFDEDDTVLSIQEVTDGVEGEPCKSYLYLETGLQTLPIVQAYVGEDVSYAGIDDDNSGYVCLGAYLYFQDDTFEWNYYYLYWDTETTGIANVAVDADAQGSIYNVLGQPVNDTYKGFVIKNGKKYLNR